jgi:hypothetical protein
MTSDAIDANAGEPVQCTKCEQPNPATSEVCSHCGAHLFVYCRECGKKNPRVARRCRCGAELHRPRRRRSTKKVVRKRIKLTLLTSAFVAFGIVMIYSLVVILSGLKRLLFH